MLEKSLAVVRTYGDEWSWLSIIERVHVETVGKVWMWQLQCPQERETDKLHDGTSNKSVMYWTPKIKERVSRIIAFYNRLSLIF